MNGKSLPRAGWREILRGVTRPEIRIVPPIAAAIRFPDLHAAFPMLDNPEEAAFIGCDGVVAGIGGPPLLSARNHNTRSS